MTEIETLRQGQLRPRAIAFVEVPVTVGGGDDPAANDQV